MGTMRTWLAAPLLLLLLATAHGASDAPFAPLVHSAALTVEAAHAPGALLLRMRGSNPAAPLAVSAVSAALDGQALTVSARTDGTWQVALPPVPGAGAGLLEVRISHDGITELLSAKLPEAARGEAGGSGIHNQLFWWVLNIAIVLIAALAISRRTS
jgi:hypothetical protein